MVKEIDFFGKDNPIYICKLDPKIIQMLNLNIDQSDIVIWRDRLTYIEKHKKDFDSEEDYLKHVKLIPEIISNPDYVAKHPNGKSIEFIKRIDKLMLVAVRLQTKGKLAFRTSYPIDESKLKAYIESGTTKEISIDKM